jgi:serine/threonine protein kinase
MVPLQCRAVDEHIGAVLVETYRIDRLLGEGGMGKVFEATHLRLPKRFAVKMLNVSMLGNLEALLRFRREAEIVATLDHPSIVTLFDYNVTEDGVPYVVLEFLDGEHLGKRISRGKLGLPEAMRIIVPVAQALQFAHGREIVHRDLKPENILILKNDSVKVVDFGIAKIRGGMELTGVNTILGTVPYMAPEQLLGGKIDARTDQFALGSIAYEMLTGDMAFGASNVPAAAARVAHHHPPPVADVPDAVNRALARAMSKQADERFPSVDAFLHAIVEAASNADRPPVIVVESEGLPPLAGEATAITVARQDVGPTASDVGEDVRNTVPSARQSVITDRTALADPPGEQGEQGEQSEDVVSTQEMSGTPWAVQEPSTPSPPPPAVVTPPVAVARSHTPARVPAVPALLLDAAVDATLPLPSESTAVTRGARAAPATVLSPIIAAPVEHTDPTFEPGALTSSTSSRLWFVLVVATLAGLAVGIWVISHH